MEFELFDGEQSHSVKLEKKKNSVMASVDGVELLADICSVSSDGLSLLIAGQSRYVRFVVEGENIHLHCDGQAFLFFSKNRESESKRASGNRPASGSKSCITAPMPGCVLKVCKKEGDRVEEGECLVILEAMKMESELFATITGLVKRIYVHTGDQVEAGESIVDLI